MIRWRQPRDDKGIVELVRTQLVPISPWQHPTGSRLHYEISRRVRRGATLVASRTRRSPPIAFLHMEFRGPTLLIDLLAVDSRHQSKQLGTALMRHAEQYARNKGSEMSHVYVDEENYRALSFYRRLGYHTLRAIPSLKVVELIKSLQ
ncbi:GNAT family N-acetyltransferase [Cohnella cholangitidis]|uniref:GNAT family N-acetyltransferase n=1 Tax=Cohnella cholangitidis TaxID=2598458 RepID=A0A7G5C2J0_9BACL|nr:GNAT family N-acetyltransferase [Cohnella cholangitidis]QMV43424.1 GNAT family N-acetyltransferase [Cohnella cholangitidis]